MARTFLHSFAALLATAAPLLAQQLLTDPALVQGRFDNGLRYVIRAHDNPQGRFQARLHIRAGALHEVDAQNGAAHFLEHLAFNGSAHYAPGELIPELNELGMQFGADSNAHTALDETVFKLSMPGNSPEMLATALTILGDFANGLSLAEAEIEHERGVILEEQRASLGPQERIGKRVRKWLFEGSRLEVHDVIGPEERIRNMSRAEFVDFWDTWYRPERMTLIVVGDVDPAAVIAEAAEHLGGFEARAEVREWPGSGVRPSSGARALVVSDPEVVQGTVQMVSLRAGREPARTTAESLARLRETLGVRAFTLRLQDMVQKGEAPWLFAAASTQSVADLRQATVFAVGRPERWQPMLEGLVRELKRAVEHGFTAVEVERVYRGIFAAAERAQETEDSLEASAHMDSIASGVARDAILMSAGQRLELLRQLDGVEPAEVTEAFAAAMGGRDYAFVLVLPETEDVPSDQDVLAVVVEARSVQTEAVEASAETLAVLEELPEPGTESSRSTDEDLGVTTVAWQNGVLMHHRRMTRPANSVAVALTISGGVLQETAANRGVTDVASLAAATSRLDSLQVRDAMVGKKASVRLMGGSDALGLVIEGAPDDLEDGLQLAHALLCDGRVEQTTLDSWQQRMLQDIERARIDLQAQFGIALRRAQFGDDVRFGELTEADVQARSVAEAGAWLRSIVDGAPIEIAVVGDLDLERAVELVGRYFGSLPPVTRGFDSLDELRQVELPAGAQDVRIEVETVTDKAMVLVGFRGCDLDRIYDRRVLNLAAKILTDRMRVRVREELGLVYSIQCASQSADSVPGAGLFFAAAPTDPAEADELADTLLAMMCDFAETGPTEDEVEVARKQAQEALEQVVEQPGFWLQHLSRLHFRGRELGELHDLDTIFDDFSVEDLRAVARKYFVDERRIRVVAIPKS